MYVFLVALTFVMAGAIGWSIGANDAANSLGTAVGSRIVTLRQAIILIVVFGFLGAYFQGAYVVKTVGNNIVPLSSLSKDRSLVLALVSVFSACLWVVLATYRKLPISTSHSIVGSVAGGGLAIGAPVQWKVLGDIFICWLLTPLGAALLGYIFYRIFKNLFYRFVSRRFIKPLMSLLILSSGCYVAFTWGANDVANATGIIAGAGVMDVRTCLIFGGLAIVLGILTWGYKVIQTIGSGITHLVPVMAFAAQLASALNVQAYTLLGIPVSTSHSIVGAIFGVGLVKGIRVLNLRIMKDIIFTWVATPFVSGIISFLLFKIVISFTHTV